MLFIEEYKINTNPTLPKLVNADHPTQISQFINNHMMTKCGCINLNFLDRPKLCGVMWGQKDRIEDYDWVPLIFESISVV